MHTTQMSVADRDRLLVDWKEAKENLDAAKTAEMNLRKRIVLDTGLFNPDKTEGTQSVDLGGGWKVKAVKKLNWKVADTLDDGTDIESALLQIQKMAGSMAADELIKFSPRLSVSVYKKLTDEEKQFIDPFLTSSEASPSLSLVPPKQ